MSEDERVTEDEEYEDAGPRQIPWRKIVVVVLVVIIVFAAYTEISNSITSGEPYPARVTVTGVATLPAASSTASIAHYVYFNFPNNSSWKTATIQVQNNKWTYSIVLGNRINYTVQIGYTQLVGTSATCDAGSLNLQSHSANYTYDAACAAINE